MANISENFGFLIIAKYCYNLKTCEQKTLAFATKRLKNTLELHKSLYKNNHKMPDYNRDKMKKELKVPLRPKNRLHSYFLWIKIHFFQKNIMNKITKMTNQKI